MNPAKKYFYKMLIDEINSIEQKYEKKEKKSRIVDIILMTLAGCAITAALFTTLAGAVAPVIIGTAVAALVTSVTGGVHLAVSHKKNLEQYLHDVDDFERDFRVSFAEVAKIQKELQAAEEEERIFPDVFASNSAKKETIQKSKVVKNKNSVKDTEQVTKEDDTLTR